MKATMNQKPRGVVTLIGGVFPIGQNKRRGQCRQYPPEDSHIIHACTGSVFENGSVPHNSKRWACPTRCLSWQLVVLIVPIPFRLEVRN